MAEQIQTISQLDTLTADKIKPTDVIPIENSEATFGVNVQELIQKYAKDIIDQQFVGSLEYFSNGAPTTDWLLCNGGEYEVALYPRLAKYLGVDTGAVKFKVPNTQGYFVRSADANRKDGSTQQDAMQKITGSFSLRKTGQSADVVSNFSGSIFRGGDTGSGASADHNGGTKNLTLVSFDSSRQTRTDSETRPKNIAYKQYIHI